jgi:alpha-D-ribose 1-methylphosphonate 5-triphosphate synthase subunit PhnH
VVTEKKKPEKTQYLDYSLYTYWVFNCSLTAVVRSGHKAAITHMNGFVVALHSCSEQRLILLTLQDADSPFFRSTHLRSYYVQFNMEVLALLYVGD